MQNMNLLPGATLNLNDLHNLTNTTTNNNNDDFAP